MSARAREASEPNERTETPVTLADPWNEGKDAMPRLNAPRAMHRGGFSPLGPLSAAGALLGVLAMVLLAVVTLGLA